MVNAIGGQEMSKPITILSALLVLQLLIASILAFNDATVQHGSTAKALVSVDKQQLRKIAITEGNDTLTLINNNDHWQLENYPDLPLVKHKIAAVVDELLATQVTWPVTSTSSSHQRFGVAADQFEKQVVFIDQDNNEQRLFLGTSPSFKKLYARNQTEDDVFAIEFNGYQLSSDANDWLDKSLLAIDGITQLNHAVINVEKQDDTWQLTAPSALSDQQSLAVDSIEDLINQLTSLQVTGIAKTNKESTNQLTVYDNSNEKYIYSFAADDENYFVKRSDIDHWFTISKPKFEKFAQLSVEQFVIENNQQEEEVDKVSE